MKMTCLNYSFILIVVFIGSILKGKSQDQSQSFFKDVSRSLIEQDTVGLKDKFMETENGGFGPENPCKSRLVNERKKQWVTILKPEHLSCWYKKFDVSNKTIDNYRFIGSSRNPDLKSSSPNYTAKAFRVYFSLNNNDYFFRIKRATLSDSAKKIFSVSTPIKIERK